MHSKYAFTKKIYISILTTALILSTAVATTYAWVGVLTNSIFDAVDINIRASELSDYNIELSTTGKEDSFSETISLYEVKRQILLNWGYSKDELTDLHTIDTIFSSLHQDQCTTIPEIVDGKTKKLGPFVDIHGESTKKYYKFDLYISVSKSYDSEIDDTQFLLDAYLGEKPMQGHVKGKTLVNPYTFPSTFSNPLDSSKLGSSIELVNGGRKITSAKVDSSDACRLAFEKYKVVQKYHPEQYNDSDEPLSTQIYQQGYEYPVYKKNEGVYCFGSILPDEYNLATGYYNSTEWQFEDWHYWTMKIPTDLWNSRGVESETKDLILTSKNNHIIDSTNINEKISVNDMMKITCYFWFEGWDADCFNAINLSPVDINIEFMMDNKEEF